MIDLPLWYWLVVAAFSLGALIEECDRTGKGRRG